MCSRAFLLEIPRDRRFENTVNSSVTTRLALLLSSKRTADALDDANNNAGDSDEALLTHIASGDRQALAHLFRRYSRLVRQVAFKILRDASEADDLLQDTFVFIHGKCGTFDPSKGTARSWILQIAYSRAIDQRRQLSARHFYTHLALDNEVLDVLDFSGKIGSYEESLEGVFGKRGLKKMFDALSENQRRTLMLSFFDGYSFDEIAVRLGQSVGNVRNHYFRGLDRLRSQITAHKSKDR